VLNRAPKRSVLQFDTPTPQSVPSGTRRSDRHSRRRNRRLRVQGIVSDGKRRRNDHGPGGQHVGRGFGRVRRAIPGSPADDWQRWNAQRDRIVLARGKSYGYLPTELRVYSSDFEENGRWVNVRNTDTSGPHDRRDRRLGSVSAWQMGVEGRRLRLGRL